MQPAGRRVQCLCKGQRFETTVDVFERHSGLFRRCLAGSLDTLCPTDQAITFDRPLNLADPIVVNFGDTIDPDVMGPLLVFMRRRRKSWNWHEMGLARQRRFLHALRLLDITDDELPSEINAQPFSHEGEADTTDVGDAEVSQASLKLATSTLLCSAPHVATRFDAAMNDDTLDDFLSQGGCYRCGVSGHSISNCPSQTI